MSSVKRLLALATVAGPHAARAVRMAWPLIKDNDEVKANLQRFLDRLNAAQAQGKKDKAGGQVAVLRQEAARFAARATTAEQEAQAAGWSARLDDIESATRLLEAMDGVERARHARQVRQQLTVLKRQMLAATLGVRDQDVPAPAPGDDGPPVASDAPPAPEDRLSQDTLPEDTLPQDTLPEDTLPEDADAGPR